MNYPVHEKELLAVVCALRKWKYDLLGVPFYVYTDHKTLLNSDLLGPAWPESPSFGLA